MGTMTTFTSVFKWPCLTWFLYGLLLGLLLDAAMNMLIH